MRVLFTSPILEHPAAGGPQLRIESSIKALSRACDLWVMSRSPEGLSDFESTKRYFETLCKEYTVTPQARDVAENKSLWARLRRRIQRLSGSEANTTANYLLQHVDRIKADVLWFGYGNISYPVMRAVRRLRPHLKTVCDTDSVWSRFVLRELPYAKGRRRAQIARAGRKKEAEEREWVQFCDVTTAVSEVDADYYRELTPEKHKVHLFPNVIDVDSYRQVPPPPRDFRRPCIYLAGSFGHENSPMDTAARWVLDEIFPALLKKIPLLHFYIVGNHSDRSFGHLNGLNITATGRLDSVLPYLCHADVALVPLKFESGTRFKILEAGACGVPIVSTTLGAEGIPVTDGKDVLLADRAPDFANAILRVIENPSLAKTLAANCRELVIQDFSIDALAGDAEEILAYLEGLKK